MSNRKVHLFECGIIDEGLHIYEETPFDLITRLSKESAVIVQARMILGFFVISGESENNAVSALNFMYIYFLFSQFNVQKRYYFPIPL